MGRGRPPGREALCPPGKNRPQKHIQTKFRGVTLSLRRAWGVATSFQLGRKVDKLKTCHHGLRVLLRGRLSAYTNFGLSREIRCRYTVRKEHVINLTQTVSGIPEEVKAQLRQTLDDLVKGIHRPDKMKAGCERMDRMREPNRNSSANRTSPSTSFAKPAIAHKNTWSTAAWLSSGSFRRATRPRRSVCAMTTGMLFTNCSCPDKFDPLNLAGSPSSLRVAQSAKKRCWLLRYGTMTRRMSISACPRLGYNSAWRTGYTGTGLSDIEERLGQRSRRPQRSFHGA